MAGRTKAGTVKGRGGKKAARSRKPAARAVKRSGTTREEWFNLGRFLVRYAVLVGIVLCATYTFRRVLDTLAPYELNLVYLPLFLVAVTGIFGILNFDRLKRFAWEQNWHWSLFFVALGLWNLGTYALIKYRATQAFAYGAPTAYLVLQGAFYAVGFALVALGVFGTSFARTFSKQLLLVSIVAVPYVSLTVLLRSYWDVFSALVTHANVWLMGFVTHNVASSLGAGDPTLALESFQVIIGAPCSGVDSLLLFTGLYWFVGLLDFDVYNKAKLLLLYPVGLAGTFAMSILRIFLLMLVGAYRSPQFALGGFHANAGWVIFVVYFLTFIYFAMPWLKK